MLRGKKKYLLLLIPIFVVFIYVNSKGTYATDEPIDATVARNALVNTAYAFQYRGNAFQYDDSNMTYNNSNKKVSRNDLYITPEDATSQSIKYSSCSPFLFNVYNNVFSKNDDSGNYEIGYYNKNNEYVTTINSNHFTLMANPYYNVNNDNYVNSYYESDIAVYNIAVKKVASGEDYHGQISYGGETADYRGFSRTISPYEYNDNTLEKDKYTIVENIPGEDEIEVTIDNYQDATDFRHQLAEYMMDKIIDYAEVGDIIGYIYDGGNNSHVVMVSAIDKELRTMEVIHSFNGTSYDYINKKDKNTVDGTVVVWNVDTLKTGRNYGFYRDDLAQVSIIRPLNRIITSSEYKMTDSAISRNDYPMLVATKTASVSKYQSININDDIVYIIELKNLSASDTYTDIHISDSIINNTSYVSCTNDCVYDEGDITCDIITLNTEEAKTFTYTLKVNNDIDLIGSAIVNNNTYVNGIKLNSIETTINNTLSNELQLAIVNKAHAMDNHVVDETYDGRNLIQGVYNQIGVSGFDFTGHSAEQLMELFYTVDTVNIAPGSDFNNRITAIDSGNMNRYTLKSSLDSEESIYTNMFVDGLYGGVYVDSAFYEATDVITGSNSYGNGRTKYFRNDTLMIGDVLFLYDDDYADETSGTGNQIPVSNLRPLNAYLYIGNGEFATVTLDSEDRHIITIIENNEEDNPSRLLSSLIGQNAFVVLRPSYSADEDIVPLKGDVNSDGFINEDDVVALVMYIIEGTSQYQINELLAGDMNDDTEIKMNDVMMLLEQIYND